MGFHRRVILLITAATLGASGCRTRRTVEDEHAPPPTLPAARTAAPSARPPVDRTLPGELAEGSLRAFGLPLPRVMKVKGSFEEVVFASGNAPAHQVANYVRQRVIADKIVTGPEKTVFSRASVKATPGPLMTISVVAHGDKTEIEVRDITPKPAKPGLTPEERWRELGLNPDGSPIDPTQLH